MVQAAALVAILLCVVVAAVRALECRQGPDASTQHCGLPMELANFQGYYLCNNSVKVGRPTDKSALVQLVSHYSHVKGVGIGHSWWGSQFCSGNDSDSINIVTTELTSTLDLILDPVYYNSSRPPPPGFPIFINETSGTVTVQAGVPQRILLDSLAQYTSPKAPNGYSIAAFPWYIDQTIAGAVSTGTHGSSFQHGSVSSQTVRIELALANGTLANFTGTSNPTLWRAVQIAVGRLGVITEMELSLIPQDMVTRVVTNMDFWEFVQALHQLQDDYNAALNGTGAQTVAQVLASYEGTQIFWFVPSNLTTWLNYTTLEQEAEAPLAAEFAPPPGAVATTSISALNSGSTPAAFPPLTYNLASNPAFAPGAYLADSFAQVPEPALQPVLLPATDPVAWNELQYSYLVGFLTNGTFERRDSILAETDFVNKATSDTDPYDQYEFSIPLQTAGDCIQTVGDAMYSQDLLLGFSVPPLIRFVGPEQPFLSNANGGPRIFFNIEDHQSYQTGKPNTRFDAVVKILREADECKARMHWGKAGWEKWAPCFDGATEYPQTWCHFGCAVQSLDPNGKFASQSNVWSWSATVNGQDVPFQQCCDDAGFMSTCVCAHRTCP